MSRIILIFDNLLVIINIENYIFYAFNKIKIKVYYDLNYIYLDYSIYNKCHKVIIYIYIILFTKLVMGYMIRDNKRRRNR